jgi:hypothetical protein
MSPEIAAMLSLAWERVEGCSSLAPTLWTQHLLDWSDLSMWRAFQGDGMVEFALSFQAWMLTGSKLWAACYFTH